MPIAVLIGGVLETILRYEHPFIFTDAWPDVTRIAMGAMGELRLSADGITPGPPDGVSLVAGPPLGPFVQFPVAQMQLQMLGDGYRWSDFGWDWRKDMNAAADTLAGQIRDTVTADDPCTLVGHSAGGLVARLVWARLVAAGETAKVRRIITVGTPHWGSYYHVLTWAGENPFIDQLIWVNHNVGGACQDPFGIIPYRQWTRDEIVDLSMTWPCLYQLLPVIGGPDDPSDVNRPLLYDADNWPSTTRPFPSQLAAARGPWRDTLFSAATRPPPDVLTCVVGRGYRTPDGLKTAGRVWDADNYGSDDGDSVVTAASQVLAGGLVVNVSCDHPNLIPNITNSGLLRELVLDNRAPSPDPPPPRTVVDPMPVLLIDPPMITPGFGTGAPVQCQLHVCRC